MRSRAARQWSASVSWAGGRGSAVLPPSAALAVEHGHPALQLFQVLGSKIRAQVGEMEFRSLSAL